jgi:hypothetical protein
VNHLSPSAAPAEKAADGGLLDPGDLRFARDLLQFLHGLAPATGE